METEAPSISRNYPLAGERIGPAWRGVWRILSETDWILKRAISRKISERYEVEEKTVDGLLAKAARAGILERAEVMHNRRKSVAYRVARSNQSV